MQEKIAVASGRDCANDGRDVVALSEMEHKTAKLFELAILQKRVEATGIECKMAIHFLESDQSAGWFKSNSKGV